MMTEDHRDDSDDGGDDETIFSTETWSSCNQLISNKLAVPQIFALIPRRVQGS